MKFIRKDGHVVSGVTCVRAVSAAFCPYFSNEKWSFEQIIGTIEAKRR